MWRTIRLLALGLGLGLSSPAGTAAGFTLIGVPVGMTEVGRGLFVDKAAGAAEIAAIRQRIAAAAAGTKKALGPLRAAPVWQVCVTPECDRRNNMTKRAMTLGPLVITVSSRAVDDAKTYFHERIHAELHAAEGIAGRLAGRLPTWFDEGLATVISRSVGYPARRAECRKFQSWTLPETAADFDRLAKVGRRGAGPVYMASACAVLRWLDRGQSPRDAIRILRSGRALPG